MLHMYEYGVQRNRAKRALWRLERVLLLLFSRSGLIRLFLGILLPSFFVVVVFGAGSQKVSIREGGGRVFAK